MLSLVWVTGCFGCGKTESGKMAVNAKTDVLSTLRKERPRLLFTADDQERIEKLAEKNELLRKMIESLKARAVKMLTEPLARYDLFRKDDKLKKLVGHARRSRDKIQVSAMAYRLSGDRRFLKRATKEMLACAAAETWNPRHFLDVAEMTFGMAAGYDWLYDALSKKDRATIRKAIVEKGLQAGAKAYREKMWWSDNHSNWNLVCNGGLVAGAVALADEEPELARDIISRAVASVRAGGMTSYKPDGCCYEGPGYWGFGTTYNVLLIAALDGALGKDFGLSKIEGFSKTGSFPVYMRRPSETRSFNFSDCSRRASGYCPILFWLAKKFNNPLYAWSYRRQLEKSAAAGKYSSSVWAIAWFNELGGVPKASELPLDKFFRGKADVVTMRGAWGDKNAMFLGFKGGQNSLSHPHMDIGSFVLDTDGVEWALDIGPENYNVPGYWNWGEYEARWKYFRVNSRSHNTLMIGDKLQRVEWEDTASKIVDYASTPKRTHAIVNMTNAYRQQAKKVMRGVMMIERSAVLIQDEINCLDNSEIRWAMATEAKIELKGSTATLRKNKKTLTIEILEPAGAKFEIVSPPTARQRRTFQQGHFNARLPCQTESRR